MVNVQQCSLINLSNAKIPFSSTSPISQAFYMALRLEHCYYMETRGSLHLKLHGTETGKLLILYEEYFGPDPVNYWKSLLKNVWPTEGTFWHDIQYPEYTRTSGKSTRCWMPWKIEHLLYKMSKGKNSCCLEDLLLCKVISTSKLPSSYHMLRSFHIS